MSGSILLPWSSITQSVTSNSVTFTTSSMLGNVHAIYTVPTGSAVVGSLLSWASQRVFLTGPPTPTQMLKELVGDRPAHAMWMRFDDILKSVEAMPGHLLPSQVEQVARMAERVRELAAEFDETLGALVDGMVSVHMKPDA